MSGGCEKREDCRDQLSAAQVIYMLAPHVLVAGKGSTGFLKETMGVWIDVKDDGESRVKN